MSRPRTGHRAIDELLRQLHSEGHQISCTTRRHVRVLHRTSGTALTLPGTPSNTRLLGPLVRSWRRRSEREPG